MNPIIIPEFAALTPQYQIDQVVVGKSHFYDVSANGMTERLPGVTGFLGVINKPALVPWAKKEALFSVEKALVARLGGEATAPVELSKDWIITVLAEASKRPQKITEEAADLGTQAHAMIDLIVRGQEPGEIPEPIQAPVNAFREWWKDSGIQIVLGDTKVASRKFGYGGSLDALGWRNGKFLILDWKTSSGLYNEYALQVAAYAQAFAETYGCICEEAIVVRFGKKLPIEFEKKEVADLQLSFRTFLAAKELKESLEKSHFQDW
jgi:hypothetical protein